MTRRLARILRALAVDADLLRRRRELRLVMLGEAGAIAAGVEMISWSSGPLLGNAEAGVAAELLGLHASIVAGGALCVAGCGALAAALPRLWAYDSRQAAERSLRTSGSDVAGF